MVAVQMRDEDGANLREANVRTAQQHLCAFAAIDEKQFSTQLHNLRRRVMLQRRQRASAA